MNKGQDSSDLLNFSLLWSIVDFWDRFADPFSVVQRGRVRNNILFTKKENVMGKMFQEES